MAMLYSVWTFTGFIEVFGSFSDEDGWRWSCMRPHFGWPRAQRRICGSGRYGYQEQIEMETTS
jgi:hypothetical protein